MGLQSVLKDMKVMRVANDAVAGTTDVTTIAIDMAGFDSVCFIAALGDVTNGSVLLLTAYSNASNAASGGTAITNANAGLTATSTSADNDLIIVDVLRPANRYVYATLNRGTANAVVDGIIAILYNARSLPVTLDASVVASVFVAAQ